MDFLSNTFIFALSYICKDAPKEYIVGGANSLEELKYELNPIFDDFSGLTPEFVKKLVGFLRTKGFFVEAYKIRNKEVLFQIKSPFIFFQKEKGFLVVQKVDSHEENIHYLDSKFGFREMSWDKFLKSSRGIIISFPIENILLGRMKSTSYPLEGKFVVIYTHHKYTNFELVKDTIDKLRKEAKAKGWQILYIDELGLIPQRSVEFYSKNYKLDERTAFKRIKEELQKEVANLARGYPIYDPMPFYQKLYSYLAKVKMQTVIEDLDYELWEKIVEYDEEALYNQAVQDFVNIELLGYLKKVREFTTYFFLYNMKLRDELFVKQITNLMKSKPNTLIFTIRGSAHFGLGEKINMPNWDVECMVVSKGRLYEGFNQRTWLQVLWSNNVNVDPKLETMMLAQTYINDVITFKIEKEKNIDIITARRISYKALSKMKWEDLKKLFSDLKHAEIFGVFQKDRDSKIINFIYNWMIKNGFLKN